jgi:hypothetical protein
MCLFQLLDSLLDEWFEGFWKALQVLDRSFISGCYFFVDVSN